MYVYFSINCFVNALPREQRNSIVFALLKVTEWYGEQGCFIMANEAGLAVLRECKRDDCDYKVPNGVADLKDILMAMTIHPASGGGVGGGGGGGKSNAPIPQLEENISEVSWTSWWNRFERWQLSCKISDKAAEYRIFRINP